MEAVKELETDEQTYYQELKEFLDLESRKSAEDINEWASKKWGSDVVKCLARIQKRASHYCLLDGVLHHGKESPKPVITRRSEQKKILQDIHVQNKTGIHNGVSKMYSTLCASYFWRGLYSDVKNFVRSCGYCIELPANVKGCLSIAKSPKEIGTNLCRSKSPIISKGSHFGSSKRRFESKIWCDVRDLDVENDNVWRKVEINLLGPYQQGENRKKIIAVVVDPVSHWISAEIFLMTDELEQLTKDVSRYVFSLFCTFGFPKSLSLVEGCKLKREILFSNLECMMRRINFSETQSSKIMTEDEYPTTPNPPTLLSLTGITLEKEAMALLPIELNITSSSSCSWAWKLMENYVHENENTWDLNLDVFLFAHRRNNCNSLNKCPFYQMYGRESFNGEIFSLDKGMKIKRRKLKSSVFQCRHCQERFTSKISFNIHQKKHTEEAQLRGLIDEDTSDEMSHISSSNLQLSAENMTSRLPSSDSNAEMPEVSNSKSTFCQKSSILHSSATSHRRKMNVKTTTGKKQYQRGITRLLNLAQIGRGLASKGMSDEIPKDSHRANFTAQTVASVRASLEAKRRKRISRGNYQRYSPELREEIAKYAINHGTQQAVQHFSGKLGGKPISESTVRNFIKALCSPSCQKNSFRNQGLEEEIGRFSAVSGTDAAIRCFSSKLGREIKRGTVCRLRRAYISKHPEDVAVSKNFCRKKCDTGKRKRRFGAMLRDEIGCYASEHGVAAAAKHFSERLLFPVRVLTVEKFLKLHMEKKAKNNLIPIETVPIIEKTSCIPTHVSPSVDLLNSSLDVLGGYHQSNVIERLDQVNSITHLMCSEGSYGGLQHTMQNQQQSSNSLNPENFNTNDVSVYSDDHHSTSRVILSHGIPVSFCNSQDLNFSSVQSYPSYDHNSLQVSLNSFDHSTRSVNMAIESSPQGTSIGNVPVSHVLSQHSNIIVGHSSLITSHNSPDSMQNPHQPTILSINNSQSENNSSVEGQVLTSNHSVGLTTLLPCSSFDHIPKSQSADSQTINPNLENAVQLHEPTMSSLQKSLVPKIDSSYLSISLSAPQTFQVSNDTTYKTGQVSVTSKSNTEVVPLNPPNVILEESMIPVTLESNQVHKFPHSNNEDVGGDKRIVSEVPLETYKNCSSRGEESVVSNFCENSASVPNGESYLLGVPEKDDADTDSCKGILKRKIGQTKKSKKVSQNKKPKRGTYTFYSPELRARIGRYAAEHGNLQASKHFEAEVGHQIPESTIRGLRDKYVMKQMQVAATTGSGEDNGVLQTQVTALGYAPRGRPMRLGKYDEIVQDCMHELVNSGEKVCSMLAITTARQVLTQYEPSLLEEFGGPIKLNNSWAKSFLKRMGLSNNS